MFDYSLIPAVLLALGCFFVWRTGRRWIRVITTLFALALLSWADPHPYPVAREVVRMLPAEPDSLWRHQEANRAWFNTGVRAMQLEMSRIESLTAPERTMAIVALIALAATPARTMLRGPKPTDSARDAV